MSDSEDEFVSASEGEDDVPSPPKAAKPARPLLEEKAASAKTDHVELEKPCSDASTSASSPDDLQSVDEAAKAVERLQVGDAAEEDPKEESIVQDVTHDDVVQCKEEEDRHDDVISKEEVAAPTPVKKEEKVEEPAAPVKKEKVEAPAKKPSTSSESEGKKDEWEAVEKADDGGWDDWGKEEIEEKETKEEEEDASGWDDWPVDECDTTPKTSSSNRASAPPVREAEKKGAPSQDGWGWGGVLSAVGEKFSSAVESGLGFPSPEEMARRSAEMEKIIREKDTPLPEKTAVSSHGQLAAAPASSSSFAPFSVFSGFVTGGIDVLETIGKKTFETITVRNPNAGGRRRFIFEAERGQNLSEVLRELRAREEAAASSSSSPAPSGPPPLPDLATAFERSDGMIHLEALELMAANRPKGHSALQRQLLSQLETESVDSWDNDDDFAVLLAESVKAAELPYAPAALLQLEKELEGRLRRSDGISSEELFREGVDSLVQFTAGSVHLLSKLASLVAVLGRADFSPFLDIYRCLARRAAHIANLHMLAIAASDSSSHAEELGTQLLVEAATAVSFIRQAHALLLPLLDH